MSALITNQLRDFVAANEAAVQGYQKITLSFRESGELPRSIAFHGRWLINPGTPWEQTWASGEWQYAVALTAKNRVAIFNFKDGARDANGVYGWGKLSVFESFAEANASPDVPTELVAAAMIRKGIEIEMLDI